MSDYDYTVVDWWDADNHHHDAPPSPQELQDDARQITIHVTDTEGNELYFTSHSFDGWEPRELEADVWDAYEYYVGGE